MEKIKKSLKFSKKSGFTLIELLIVIAIIGILAGVIISNTSAARNKARVSAGFQSIKSVMSMATSCYLGGGNVQAPAVTTGGGDICDSDSSLGVWPLVGSDSTIGCAYDTTAALYPDTPVLTCGTGIITCTTTDGHCSQS